jgi:para-nitrobenzyl esterase
MKPTRRNFIQSLGVGVAGLGISQQAVANASETKSAKPAADDQVLFVGDNIAIANTEHGKVRGFMPFISF